MLTSSASLEYEIAHRSQKSGGPVDSFEHCASFLVDLGSALACRINAVQCRVSGLFRLRIFARGLAEVFCGCCHVKQIVGNLEKKAEMPCIITHNPEFLTTYTCHDRSTTC